MLGVDNLHRVAKGDLFIETHALDKALISLSDGNKIRPLNSKLRDCALLQFYKSNELESDTSNWFAISTSAITGMLETAGFTVDATSLHGPRTYVRAHANSGFPPSSPTTPTRGRCFTSTVSATCLARASAGSAHSRGKDACRLAGR